MLTISLKTEVCMAIVIIAGKNLNLYIASKELVRRKRRPTPGKTYRTEQKSRWPFCFHSFSPFCARERTILAVTIRRNLAPLGQERSHTGWGGKTMGRKADCRSPSTPHDWICPPTLAVWIQHIQGGGFSSVVSRRCRWKTKDLLPHYSAKLALLS